MKKLLSFSPMLQIEAHKSKFEDHKGNMTCLRSQSSSVVELRFSSSEPLLLLLLPAHGVKEDTQKVAPLTWR